MVAVKPFDLREPSRNPRIRLTAGHGVLRIILGFASCAALSGCVTDGAATAGGADAAAAVNPSPAVETAALDGKTSAMVEKARALAFADPTEARPPAQIDLALLAARSNSGATHRLDGPSSPGATTGFLPPEEVVKRLRELSRDAGTTSGGDGRDDRTQAIRERLQALSHHPAPADASGGPQLAAAQSAAVARPVSPEAMLRRMKELSGGASDAGAPAGGGGAHDAPQLDAAAFGGLTAVVPAPEMQRTPAVERAIGQAAGAPQ